MKTLKFLSCKANDNLNENIMYVTFSRIEYLKHIDNHNILYFFDIPHDVNEKSINSLIEQNLFSEARNNNNEFYPLSFKYIYKYFLTYNQFYNRLKYLIINYKDISKIEYSSDISFIFTHAVTAICDRYSKICNSIDEKFDGFSYRHNDEMVSDIPFKIDNHDFYILLYSMYLRLLKHKIFILPSSFVTNLPNSSNILRSSIFSIFDKFKRIFGFYRSSKNPAGLLSIKFSTNHNNVYILDNNIWSNFRSDQIILIESLVNAFFTKFPPTYLKYLRFKIQKLIRWSNTKCIILDETIDAYRRLITSVCKDEKVEVEYMPHGIISEQLQFSYTSDKDYTNRYIPKTLAWNVFSSDYLKKMNLSSEPITFPINISPNKGTQTKDILVMLSHGDRVNLNQFEEDILNIIEVVDNSKYKIDWKIHQNIFEDSNNIMNQQKVDIENTLNIKLNFINHNIKSSSIMKNYDLIIFTTYTTGIYEATLLNVPFIIYSNENEKCHGINVSNLPVAHDKNDLLSIMKNKQFNYLADIKKSLLENVTLKKYLEDKCA